MVDRLESAAINVPGVETRVLAQCDSTNAVLLKDASFTTPILLAAEKQTSGRGRRGRRWRSLPGGLTFSLGRVVRRPLRELAAVSLVAGVAAARALRALGAEAVSLKWPNDLVVGEAKLGGILVETKGQEGAARVVVGIGINVRGAPKLERPVTDLESHMKVGSRNRVIEAIAAELMRALDRFEREGLETLRGEWEALDANAGQKMRVRLADGKVVTGVAAGLAQDGGLKLLTRSGMRAITSGRVVTARAS